MDKARLLLPFFALTMLLIPNVLAEQPEKHGDVDSVDATLHLYFLPAAIDQSKLGSDFVPQIARLYIDGGFVGNDVVNLVGHSPVLRLAAGEYTVRVDMADEKKSFESKILMLGRGSTQILVVDFDKKTIPSAKRR